MHAFTFKFFTAGPSQDKKRPLGEQFKGAASRRRSVGAIQAGMVATAILLASPRLGAQTIPYAVHDKETLVGILSDAKTHLASNANDVNWLSAAGIASHQLANLNVKGASDDAVQYLKQATELAPDNAVLLAHLGSAYAMAARDSSFVVNKVSNVNKGLAALDRAVKKDARNLIVRLIRASVSYDLPAMFSRKATAESDYLFYVTEAKAGAQVPPDRLAEAHFKLGQIAKEDKRNVEARDFYTQAQNAAPQSDWARQARRAMP